MMDSLDPRFFDLVITGKCSASRYRRVTLDTHSTEGKVDPRVSTDNMEEIKFLPLPGLGLRPTGRHPADSTPTELSRLCITEDTLKFRKNSI
jgi:hypothetical protein